MDEGVQDGCHSSRRSVAMLKHAEKILRFKQLLSGANAESAIMGRRPLVVLRFADGRVCVR